MNSYFLLLIHINYIEGSEIKLVSTYKQPEVIMKKQVLALMGIFVLLVAAMATTVST